MSTGKSPGLNTEIHVQTLTLKLPNKVSMTSQCSVSVSLSINWEQ